MKSRIPWGFNADLNDTELKGRLHQFRPPLTSQARRTGLAFLAGLSGFGTGLSPARSIEVLQLVVFGILSCTRFGSVLSLTVVLLIAKTIGPFQLRPQFSRRPGRLRSGILSDARRKTRANQHWCPNVARRLDLD
jgi:hypothetical protein